LEDYNVVESRGIVFCPACGLRLLKKQRVELRRNLTDVEAGDMIVEHLLEALEQCDAGFTTAEELPFLAWESESCDGVVFYDNHRASLFAFRHSSWVDESFAHRVEMFGNADRYAKERRECVDRYLVSAFCMATDHYVFAQLGVDCNEGVLSKKRIREIRRLIKAAPYDGEF
jgi:hypothetical protein